MAKSNKPGVMIYFEMVAGMKKLDYEQIGMLFMAIVNYSQTGEEPEFDEFVCDVAWDFIKPRLDNDSQRYEEVVDARKAAADARWNKKKSASQSDANASDEMQVHDEKCKCIFPDAEDFSAMQTMPTTTTTTTTTTTPTTTPTTTEVVTRTRARFTPPTADQVSVYAQETGRSIDAQRFVDFYAAKGWKVGTTPMKDWRAAVRNWCARDSAPAARQGPKVTVHQQYNQREYTHTDDAADALMGGLP